MYIFRRSISLLLSVSISININIKLHISKLLDHRRTHTHTYCLCMFHKSNFRWVESSFAKIMCLCVRARMIIPWTNYVEWPIVRESFLARAIIYLWNRHLRIDTRAKTRLQTHKCINSRRRKVSCGGPIFQLSKCESKKEKTCQIEKINIDIIGWCGCSMHFIIYTTSKRMYTYLVTV